MLVGIAAPLAATISALALGFREKRSPQAPQVAIVADYSERPTANGAYLNHRFRSGETVSESTLTVTVSGSNSSDGSDALLCLVRNPAAKPASETHVIYRWLDPSQRN